MRAALDVDRMAGTRNRRKTTPSLKVEDWGNGEVLLCPAFNPILVFTVDSEGIYGDAWPPQRLKARNYRFML